jgi:drug/metabolite transporter (DMT)-like permease
MGSGDGGYIYDEIIMIPSGNITRRTAYAFLVLTTAIWGSLYVVTRIALLTIPPVTLLLARYTIASLALLVLLRHSGQREPIARADRKYFLLIGVLGYFVSVEAQILGTRYAGAAMASLINAMNPVFIMLFAVLVLKEKLTRSKVLAACASLLGAYVILGGVKEYGAAWGIAFSLLSVVFWALAATLVRCITPRYSIITITSYVIFIATVCALPGAAIELASIPHGTLISTTNLLCVLYLGIICTVVPGLLWNKSLALVEASTCALFYPIQPLVSVLLGVVVLHERISLSMGIGALLIVGGIFYAVRAQKGDRDG